MPRKRPRWQRDREWLKKRDRRWRYGHNDKPKPKPKPKREDYE